MQTLLGLYYTDEITASFSGRQLGDDEYTENINTLAQFDQEEMGLDKINYTTQWNRLFYGVGIRAFSHWDSVKKVPVFVSVDPLTWFPDPNGYLDNHRFHGFEFEATDSELNSKIYKNLDQIKPSNSKELEEKRTKINELRKKGDTSVQASGVPIYNIYNHYTTYKGKKYLVTLTNEMSLCIRCEEITAVYDEEKKDSMNISYPIVINYFDPIEGDPYGLSICDILEDKQKTQQLFMNLNKIKAEHETWGDVFLVDTNVVKNTNELRQQST